MGRKNIVAAAMASALQDAINAEVAYFKGSSCAGCGLRFKTEADVHERMVGTIPGNLPVCRRCAE